jgi:hypothetical protein
LVQRQRAASLRRFNRLFVYLPAGLAAALALGGTAALIYLVLARTDQRVMVSAVADTLVICGILPLLCLCAVVPAGFTFGTLAMRRQKRAPLLALQRVLWRLDNMVGRARATADKIGRRLADPLIAVEARASYYSAMLGRLKRLFKRR